MPESPPALTAVVLAGGQGTRMGGVDKGLQQVRGTPLALHAARRLQAQSLPPAYIAINANRNLPTYAAWGWPVWPDAQPHYPGPLAGFEAALAHSTTPLVLTVPCDVPGFPLELAARLAHALQTAHADIAIASAPESAGAALRPQPVFCLMRQRLHTSLAQFVHAGGRKVGAWVWQHAHVHVPFDDALAFANANTPEQLRALEQAAP